jgi:hypothetical protein
MLRAQISAGAKPIVNWEHATVVVRAIAACEARHISEIRRVERYDEAYPMPAGFSRP